MSDTLTPDQLAELETITKDIRRIADRSSAHFSELDRLTTQLLPGGVGPNSQLDLPASFTLFDTKADGDWLRFSGIASTADVDLGRDILAPGCFGEVDPDNVAMLLFHDPNAPVGRWDEFERDGSRLMASGAVFKGTAKGQEAAAMLLNRVLNGLSVGFRTLKHLWDPTTETRTVTAATLVECSLVACPANRSARITTVTKGWRPRRRVI